MFLRHKGGVGRKGVLVEEAVVAKECFDVIVVGIDDAGINLGSGRSVPGGMDEEGDIAVAALITLGAEVSQHGDGGLVVLALDGFAVYGLALTADVVLAEFEEGAGDDGCCGGVL